MRLGTTLAIIAVISLLLVCPRSTGQQIDPAESRSAVFSDIYWLHCACLQVYFACNNAPRSYKKCLLTNSRLPYVNDVWHSSKFELKVNSLKMKYLCTVAETNICTVLCWKHDGYCTVVFDLSLVEERNKKSVEYNISAIDKHPQMCVQRSLQGSHNITCHFTADMSSWMVNIETRRQSIFVHINSTVPAKFSVQLCKLNLNACASIGEIQSLNTKEKLTTFQLSVLSVGERPCVQVWQSEPALYGKRILCPDYTRRRYGVYAAAALVCALITIVLGICFHRLTKKGWLYIQRPILLVCSSEDDVHVSTVCALASVLQGDLGATVHLALWGQSVQSPYGMRVADVGPLPWLHGQWDSVIKAQGIVLIMWSLDAKITYKNWWSDKESSNQKDLISHGPHKIEYSTTLTEKYKLRREDKHIPERTNVSDCSVIAPVFKAALTCLVGALQENKPQKVTFVSLHGHNSSKDIPKVFKGVPHYCLPHQFSGLLQELGVKMRRSQNSKVHCWTRLMSKILCFWLAKQLVRRLRATPQ
ncbi:interleukin-17 receptor E [Eucyclogobius newberryi]|uniref:interleukin-17 receptor E n=1 Tax=Eucyclogobius newberryi TaxID=166745 RepID=UPI003B5A0B92